MMHSFHIPDQIGERMPDLYQVMQSFSSLSIDSIHLPRATEVIPSYLRPRKPDMTRISAQLSNIHAHLAAGLGGKALKVTPSSTIFNVEEASTSSRSTTSTELDQPRGGNRIAYWLTCGCFKGYESPEITHCVSSKSGNPGLQALISPLPMLDEEELNEKFAELVEELDLSATNKNAMLELPQEKKWLIYCSRKTSNNLSNSICDEPDVYIEKVVTFSKLAFPMDTETVSLRCRSIDSLQIALRTQPNSFVGRFIQSSGLSALLNFLQTMDYDTRQSILHTSILVCLKVLMNNSTGRAQVLAHPYAVNVVAQSLSTENVRTKIAVLEILGAICLVSGGHKKVMEAMINYQKFAFERARFQGIIAELDRTYAEDDERRRLGVNLKTAIMSFINAVLSYGPGEESINFRLHLRFEFLMLGIAPIIEKLRLLENEVLNRHLNFFEMVRSNDEQELAKRFNQVDIDTNNPTSLFELLRMKINQTAIYPHFVSLLQHCLLIPLDSSANPVYWSLFDQIVQQIVLQSSQNHENPDISPIKINVQESINILSNEAELRKSQKIIEELRNENNDLMSQIRNNESDMDAKSQAKEDMELRLSRFKEKYDTEVICHRETKQRLSELETRLQGCDPQAKIENVSLERLQDTPDINEIYSNPIPSPPPQPPGPPPLPSSNDLCSVNSNKSGKFINKKWVPTSSTPLKSFNWSKLPFCKVQGTIWMGMDESCLYNYLDLKEIDQLFSAYQKNMSMEDLRYAGTLGRKNKVISVIGSRRAQNCTILLSKLKMTNLEISKAIMSMDVLNQFPVDMVEQMLKFTPTAEERAMLDEHAEDTDHFARADRFLFELSKITHYEQRLRTLYYKKKFNTWYTEFKPKIKSIIEASKEVQRSKKLKKMLEIILAFGNYMNRGQRGNAVGFKLSSLTRIADTKSSSIKNMTLMHYLVQTCETKFRNCLFLEADIPHVRDAAKVNMKELEKDMVMLRNGLKEVERENEFHRSLTPIVGEGYLMVMKEFSTKAAVRLSELEDLFVDMKARFDRVCRLFCEDPITTQSDDFFGIFDAFLVSFQESKTDNENVKRKKEEEEKIAKQHIEMRKRTLERKKSSSMMLHSTNSPVVKVQPPSVRSANDFEDLITALRTGDVFGVDTNIENKTKRVRKMRSGSKGGIERIQSFVRERPIDSY